MQDLHDAGIREGTVEEVEERAENERVDDKVFLSSADLHEAAEALKGAVRVLLQVDGDLALVLQLRHQRLELLRSADERERRLIERTWRSLSAGTHLIFRVKKVVDFIFVGVRSRHADGGHGRLGGDHHS